MAFNSFVYIFFLVLVVCAYYVLPHRYQKILLLVASYVFYGMWDYRFLSLLMISTGVDYFVSWKIVGTEQQRQRKAWLILSLFVNLGILGIFKYFNFFAENFVALFQTLGVSVSYVPLHIILPVGISFYTFQTLSYTIDVYRGKCEPSESLLDFAVFVTFFPQLVAGPIERATHLLPQFHRQRSFEAHVYLDGVWLIVLGLFKKVVIADRCATIVNQGFQGESLPEGLGSWLLLYAFAIQIYGDFSGYTDIARGSAKLMGFDIMLNFRKPYLVSNPAEFWRNWHISLSTWLRDYLYIPLGGNRHGGLLTFRNLMITMLLGGLWHGTGWAFLFWGLFHGILLVSHRLMQPTLALANNFFASSNISSGCWRAINVFAFFHVTCMGWLLFRAANVETNQATFVLESLRCLTTLAWGDVGLGVIRTVLPCGVLVFLLQLANERIEAFHTWAPVKQGLGLAFPLVCIVSLGVFESANFIYFQF